MQKTLALTALFTLISLNANSVFAQTSVTPNPNINEPVCYLQTPDGRTLDLSQICGQKDPKNTGENPTKTPTFSNFRECNLKQECLRLFPRESIPPVIPPNGNSPVGFFPPILAAK